MKDRRVLTGILACLCLECIFGLSFLFIKNAIAIAPSMWLLSWRYIVAFVFMSAGLLFGLFKVNLRGKPIKPLILLSVASPLLYFITEAWGVEYTSVSESGTLIAMLPLATVILSTVMLKIPPTKFQALGIAVSIGGIVMIVCVKGFEATFNPVGYLCLAAAVLCGALFTVLSYKLDAYTGIEKTYLGIVISAAVFTACALIGCLIRGDMAKFWTIPFTDRGFLVCILYLGIGCSTIAYFLLHYSIGILGANRSIAFSGLATVVSILSGVLLSGDRFSAPQAVGTALVLLGVYTANIIEHKKISDANEFNAL